MTTSAAHQNEHQNLSDTRRPGRLRARLAAGVAAGALLLAAPIATATAVSGVTASPGSATVIAGMASQTSGLPQTITLTTRRTGSVIL